MMTILWKGLTIITMFLASSFLWLATWGMVMGDNYPVTFSTCKDGRGYTATFSPNFSFDTFSEMVGNETIYVEIKGFGVPGFVIGQVRRPFCPDASPAEMSEYLEHHRMGLVRRRPEHQDALTALRQGYERAEDERRRRGGRVLDDEPPEDTTTIPQEEPPDDEELHEDEDEESPTPRKLETPQDSPDENETIIPGLHDRRA